MKDTQQLQVAANLTEEIATFQARGSWRGRGHGRSRGRGRGRGANFGQSWSNPSSPSHQQATSFNFGAPGAQASGYQSGHDYITRRKRWAYCKRCQKWGKHYARECPLSSAQIAKLQPEDANQPPESEPFNEFFGCKDSPNS